MAFSNVGDSPYTAFTGQSALNTVGVMDGGATHSYFSLIVVGSAGISAGAVSIELSNDNINWFAPASNSATATASSTTGVAVGPFPAQFARARISTLVTGGTVTAYVAAA